jgi:hypothetical protein
MPTFPFALQSPFADIRAHDYGFSGSFQSSKEIFSTPSSSIHRKQAWPASGHGNGDTRTLRMSTISLIHEFVVLYRHFE